jgi:hypothetical protein
MAEGTLAVDTSYRWQKEVRGLDLVGAYAGTENASMTEPDITRLLVTTVQALQVLLYVMVHGCREVVKA